MVSIYRSGLVALALAACLMTEVVAQIDRVRHRDWVSGAQKNVLSDNSLLVEYFGESSASNWSGAHLRIGFIPRFGCAPLFSVHIGLGNRKLSDLNWFRAEVDGSPIDFPVLVDDNIDHAAIYLNVNLQRRIAMRIKVDGGTRFRLRDKAGNLYSFSLIGSRAALAAAERACRVHDPRHAG